MMTIEYTRETFARPSPTRANGPTAWLFRRSEPAARVASAAADVDAVFPAAPPRHRNLRYFTPREMSELSLDLYVAGLLGYGDYAMLTFQPELHPDYDVTIGVLTGAKAQPDRPRDFVELWEDRLRFERTHGPENHRLIARIQRIVDLLHRFEDNPDERD